QGIGVLAKNKWAPLVLTSIIFGGLHFLNPEVEKLGSVMMVYSIWTGFFLGIISLMDDGLELALGFHACNNLVAALLLTADWTVFQTNSVLKDVSEPSAGFDIIAPVFIVYPIFIGIMAWRYKWTGWKDKLFGKVEPPPLVDKETIDYVH
ncbi:MAG: CPBP family intramembrane metalloprotease, partial [Flavobacterium sp.]